MKAENSSGTARAEHEDLGKGFSCASNLNRISVALYKKPPAQEFSFEQGWGSARGKGRRLSSLPRAPLFSKFCRANGFGSTTSFRVKCQFSIHFETVTETDVSDEAVLRGEHLSTRWIRSLEVPLDSQEVY